MRKLLSSPQFLVLLSAVLFFFLFYRRDAGLNSILVVGYTLWLYLRIKKRSAGTVFRLLFAGTIVLSLAVLFAHTAYSIVVFWICFSVLVGNFAYTELNHLQFSGVLLFQSIKNLFPTLFKLSRLGNSKRKVNYKSYLQFILLPALVLVTIFSLYSAASVPFRISMNNLWDHITDVLMLISFSKISFFILGLLLFGLCFVEITFSRVIKADAELQFRLIRVKKKSKLLHLSRRLLRRKQVSIVLFVVLNLMIFWLNLLDIKHIWFGFEWNGSYLKEMVHEGTYLLIAAILLSISIAIYYLNSNIVFFKRNKLFNLLIILWLTQNLIMIASVALRNSYYINYFALAYLRIFVFFFLAACIVGLCTIIIMILRKKSIGYLISVNSLSVFIIVIISCCFNWDAIIARYNFAHYKKSFVHYEFLAGLNDSALPYMNYTEEQIKQISDVQYRSFSFASSELYTKIDFAAEISRRKTAFKQRWEQHHFLEWNYPEYKAYKLLFQNQ